MNKNTVSSTKWEKLKRSIDAMIKVIAVALFSIWMTAPRAAALPPYNPTCPTDFINSVWAVVNKIGPYITISAVAILVVFALALVILVLTRQSKEHLSRFAAAFGLLILSGVIVVVITSFSVC